MSITFGAVSDTNTFANSSDSKSVSLVLGGEADRIVIAGFTMNYLLGSTTIKFNGVDMTLAEEEVAGSSYHNGVYYMLDSALPGAGTYNFTVDPEHAIRGGLWALYIYGAKQQAPEAVASIYNAAGGNPEANSIATLTNNAFVVETMLIRDGTTMSPSTSQDERFDFVDSQIATVVGTKTVATAGATSFGWNNDGSGAMLHVLTAWEAAASAAVATQVIWFS